MSKQDSLTKGIFLTKKNARTPTHHTHTHARAGVTSQNCSSVCGDGLRSFLEQCDDGNVQDGDGCDSSCTLEQGNILVPPPSTPHHLYHQWSTTTSCLSEFTASNRNGHAFWNLGVPSICISSTNGHTKFQSSH